MSTVGQSPTPPSGLKEGVDIAPENHARPHEESAMTAPNTDQPSTVTPHPEGHISDNGVTDHASVASDVQLMPQTVPLHPETQPKFDHEDAADTTGSGPGSESEGTEDEEDEDEGDEDDNEEEDEDEDEEPALKYERFGGAFQDLLKRDSASTLVVSNKYLVRCYSHAIVFTDIAMQALGTHNGFAHILDLTGERIKTFKPHTASVVDMCFDTTADFIGTASMDGEHLGPSSLSPPLPA